MNRQSLKTVLLACSTITFSVGLINFNNYLMDGRFPYAVPLTCFQQAFCTALAAMLFGLQPAWFPSLTDPVQKVVVDVKFVATGALPIGALFATSLVLTNLAYEHLSVAFLQMLKESNIVLVYLFSLLAYMEVFSWRHVQVILFAIFAASLTIKGELNFSMVGFLIQLAGGICECARIVLQGVLLSGKKVDAMSYVLLVSPVACSLLFACLLTLMVLPAGIGGPGLTVPPAAVFWEWLPTLLCNSLVAFGLNVNIALMIKNTSPTSYIFVGVVKDVVAILVSIVVLKELVSTLQFISFSLQIGTVIVWSLLKMHPQKFERGMLHGLREILYSELGVKAETGGMLVKSATEDSKMPKA